MSALFWLTIFTHISAKKIMNLFEVFLKVFVNTDLKKKKTFYLCIV